MGVSVYITDEYVVASVWLHRIYSLDYHLKVRGNAVSTLSGAIFKTICAFMLLAL